MYFAWLKNTYNKIYLGFFISIALVFFYTRPLNSDYHKFIGGDGLGYYSYLPAKFIYHDSNYEFKWFNKVHDANYVYCAFAVPDENFLVHYENRKINKYYQGLSFLWMPFFMLSHVCAKVFHYPADGFSLPYQLGIGFASMCYLFLGLFYLRKLLLALFKHELAATLTPIAIFYGTYLFYYAININSQSHIYSFTFITIFLYYAHCFFNQNTKRATHLLLAAFCFIIIVCIRPLNGLILLSIPAFIPKGFFKDIKQGWDLKKIHILALACLALPLIWQLHILYTQTGSFIPYTYSDEKFYFNKPRLADVLFSYHAGLFVYVPLALLALLGTTCLNSFKQKIIFPALFFLVIYIYSSWWYWPITTRTIIDFYPLLAILLAALITKSASNKFLKISLIALILLLVGYHQLKNKQLHSGILDENYTYKELFWKNFFRLHKTNMYVIPPSTIIKQKTYLENFENSLYSGSSTEEKQHSGKRSALLDKQNPFSKLFRYPFPKLFLESGVKKIRLSFWCYFDEDIKSTDIYMKFFDKSNQMQFETAFYIKDDFMMKNSWDYKEFGYELNGEQFKNWKDIDHVSLFIWNNENKGKLYIDDVRTEFILGDNSYEIIK